MDFKGKDKGRGISDVKKHNGNSDISNSYLNHITLRNTS